MSEAAVRLGQMYFCYTLGGIMFSIASSRVTFRGWWTASGIGLGIVALVWWL